jgi:hypothetical protein
VLDKQQLRTFIKKQRLALNENEVKAKSFSCLTQLKNMDLKDYKRIGAKDDRCNKINNYYEYRTFNS